MTDPGVQNKAVDAIMLMNTAIINLRLYPPTSATIGMTIDRLLQALSEMLAEETPLILAEAERMLLFGEEPAWPKNQEKAHVRAFIDILINQGIKSISFSRGLQKEELIAFFQTLSRKPEEARAGGGIRGMLASQEVRHIRIDEKIYLATNVSPQTADRLDAADGIIKFLMEATNLDSLRVAQLREQAKDREWIAGVFDSWLRRFKEQQGTLPKAQLSKDLVRMASMLLKIADPEDREWIGRLVSGSIAEMESEMVSLILSGDVQSLCGEQLFQQIVGGLNMDQFGEVLDGLSHIASGAGEQRRAASFSLESLKTTDRGKKLENERRAAAAKEKEERERRLNGLKERAQRTLPEEASVRPDQGLMAELPGIVRELYALDDSGTANAIVERLSANLQSRSPDLRSHAAEITSQILGDIIEDGRDEQIEPLSEKLAGWWRVETVYSASCERICRQLQELVGALLRRDPFLEINPILDILSLTQSGRSPKDQRMVALTGEALRELATEELLSVLMNEFQTNEKGRQKEAARNLARLGAAPVERLLSMLESSEDGDERARILQVISEIGAPSIPAILARILQNPPWYVLRNLAYILGRVGGEAQAREFIPLLLHENQKVQTEALKSLQRTGGKVRAETLLSVLPKVDDPFKLQIVEMLGIMKSSGAVPALLELLQTKQSIMTAALKADLDVKICIALGSICSKEALPALIEISKSKSFFNVGSYPEKVRNAAHRAIVAITRKQS
jgi:HEAT repeat protein